jgi:hypothetical protein
VGRCLSGRGFAWPAANVELRDQKLHRFTPVMSLRDSTESDLIYSKPLCDLGNGGDALFGFSQCYGSANDGVEGHLVTYSKANPAKFTR